MQRGETEEVFRFILERNTGRSRGPVESKECHMSPAPLSCPKNQADKSGTDFTQSMRGGMGNLLVWRLLCTDNLPVVQIFSSFLIFSCTCIKCKIRN